MDGASKLLLEYNEGETRIAVAESVKPAAPSASDAGASFELQGDFRRAGEEYNKARSFSPASPDLRKATGRLAVTMQRYEEGAALLSQAADAEAHYYRGVALAALGSDDDARREWSLARADARFGPAAAIGIAASLGRSGNAQAAAKELAALNAPTTRALVMQAALARAEGDAATAKDSLARAAALDATDSAIRFEQVRQGGSDPKLWEHLAADPERVLEIAALYMHWGRYRDALEALSFGYVPVPATRREAGAAMPQDHPLVAYYRGYCHAKLNEYFTEDFRLASALPVRYVFPNRPLERRVLELALQTNAGDANAHYLLGLWYLNAQRVPEGSREIQAAQRLRPDFAEARALLAALKLPLAAAPVTTPPAPASAAPAPKTEAPATAFANTNANAVESRTSAAGEFTFAARLRAGMVFQNASKPGSGCFGRRCGRQPGPGLRVFQSQQFSPGEAAGFRAPGVHRAAIAAPASAGRRPSMSGGRSGHHYARLRG